jgi:hypothetical protein
MEDKTKAIDFGYFINNLKKQREDRIENEIETLLFNNEIRFDHLLKYVRVKKYFLSIKITVQNKHVKLLNR